MAAWLQHLREQFDSLQPLLQALLQAYPGLLQPEWFTWEAFLWAVECWYAYAIEVSIRPKGCTALLARLNTDSTAVWVLAATTFYGHVKPQFRPCCLQVQWPDDSIRSCLAPFASLLNHSCSAPHIVRYSRLDPVSCHLHFTLCRPCTAGQQCYLSYGPLPSLKLLLFYGMAVDANAQDVVNLQLQVSAMSIGTWKCHSQTL